MNLPMSGGGDPTRVVGRRCFGYFFDGLIDALVLLTLISVADVDLTPTARGTIEPASDQETAALATAFLIYGLYYLLSKVLMLGFLGATPGMFMMSVRCVRWDGRPCGVWRAFVRTLVMGFISTVGVAYLGTPLALGGAAIIMWSTKGHKAPGDIFAGTYVIDSIYKGRLIIENSDGLMVGPPSVTREEAEAFLKEQAKKTGVTTTFVPPLTKEARSGTPFMDKNLDTYVVWNHKEEAWLAFDKNTGAWHQVG